METCENDALAKAHQTNVPKEGTGTKAAIPNGCWYHDQSQLKPSDEIARTKTTWHITLDKLMGFKFSAFYTAKEKFIQPFCVHMLQMKAHGQPVLIDKAMLERIKLCMIE